MNAEKIRDLSVRIYKARLEDSFKGDTERMLAKDADGGVKLRNRAESYDRLSKHYIEALGMQEDFA